MLPHIGVAILTFIITNVDDLIVLTVFFANPRYKRENVIAGQIVGIFLLVGISMVGVYLGTIMQEHHLNLLGLLPLIIGIRELINYLRNKGTSIEKEVSEQNTGFQFLNVTMVTLANGGDNIGVYMPLFANLHPNYVVVYALAFGLMTFVMCWQAYYLVSHPKFKAQIAKFGPIILPIFLIALGLYILKDLVI